MRYFHSCSRGFNPLGVLRGVSLRRCWSVVEISSAFPWSFVPVVLVVLIHRRFILPLSRPIALLQGHRASIPIPNCLVRPNSKLPGGEACKNSTENSENAHFPPRPLSPPFGCEYLGTPPVLSADTGSYANRMTGATRCRTEGL